VKACFAAALCALAAVVPSAAQASAPAVAGAHDAPMQLARGFGRGFGRSPGGFGRTRRPFGQRRTRGRGIFRRIVRALAIGYLLHLLFTTPGGLIVLVFMVLLVMLAMRRLRSRRFSY
jgi:hypothetical protein